MTDATPHRPALALVVSEHEWSTHSLDALLASNGYAVLRASSARQALEHTHTAGPDVIFIEEQLPDQDGIELCRQLRAHCSLSPSTPILLMAQGTRSAEQRLAAFRAGFWDILRLPLDVEEFLLRMTTFLRAKFDADRATAESLVDLPTGLYSARGMFARARELAAEAHRYDRALACIVVSAEADEYGRLEEAVQRVAELLRESSRGGDAVGRLGPTEFMILAPDTDPAGAWRLAERVAEAAGAAVLPLRAGVYAVPNFRGASVDASDMLARAIAALRRAQAGDGGAISVFEPQPRNMN